MNINVLSVKRKRIEKALFNIFVLGKNDYFNINMTYILKNNDYLYVYINFFNFFK